MLNDKNNTWKGLVCNLILNNSADIRTYITNINSNHQDRTQNVSHFTKKLYRQVNCRPKSVEVDVFELRTTSETFWQTTKIEKVIFRHFLQKLETFFLVGLLNKNWWDIIQPWILQKKKKKNVASRNRRIRTQHRQTNYPKHNVNKQLNKKEPWSFQPKVKKVLIIPKYKLQSDFKKFVILAKTDFRHLQTIATNSSMYFTWKTSKKNIYFKYNLEHKV
jgi:hypothetical protein